MTFLGWYEKRTIAICPPVGVEFDNSTKQLWMTISSLGTKATRQRMHESALLPSTESQPSA